ncbi:MAG: hypothetical protein PF569_09285 [Candidatus Woesearchaeota archaeon]|jgi:hypothetical protein|nr:hypothetical protein [Candidatus Woesearchaeota archaeon]
MKKKLPEITAPKLSKKGWAKGAYCLCFVYSNKGNFIVKGYVGDVDILLKEYKSKEYKFFFNKTFWHSGIHRGYWSFYNRDSEKGCTITAPDIRSKKYHFNVTNFDNIDMKFKRMPNKWIKEFDNI